MPELPEVETIVRRLRGLVVDQTITDINIHREKSFQGNVEAVKNLSIIDVTRRAKLIRFHLQNNLNLLSHLKMTGQFIYVDGDQRIGGGHPTADWVNELPSKHTRVTIDLSNQAKLFFNDMRVFGWIRLLTDREIEDEYKKYGPDVIDNSFTVDYLSSKLSRTSRAIKLAIMDNNIVAGVGNIYACDALNLAQVSPTKPAKHLTQEEIVRLFESTKKVIELGISSGGATIDNYKHVDGFSGKYQNKVLVYNREGEKCRQCGGTIIKSKIGGRGTYYCKECQHD